MDHVYHVNNYFYSIIPFFCVTAVKLYYLFSNTIYCTLPLHLFFQLFIKMEYKPNKSIFLSNEQYFLSLPTVNRNDHLLLTRDFLTFPSLQNGNEYITNDELKNMLDPNNTTDKSTLFKLTHSLKSENSVSQ